MRKVIAIDFDTVCNNLLVVWLKWLNRKYRLNKTCEDMTQWDMSKNIPELDPTQIYEPLFDADFWASVIVYPEVQTIIKEMRYAGYTPYIVTDTHYSSLKMKFENCLLPALNEVIKPSDVIVTSHKELITCEYIIDDYEMNLKDNEGFRILIDEPYNHNANKDYYDFRTHSLKDAWEYIKLSNAFKL